MKLRRSAQTAIVLGVFLENCESWQHGYDMSRITGLKSGTLYPILMRLADNGLLEASWEPAEAGRPPRHLYRLTQDGLAYAQEQMRLQKSVFTTKLSEVIVL